MEYLPSKMPEDLDAEKAALATLATCLSGRFHTPEADKAQLKKGRELLHFFEKDKGPWGSDIIRVVHPYNPHVMAPKAAYLIKDAV